jgi:hypothetical protein
MTAPLVAIILGSLTTRYRTVERGDRVVGFSVTSPLSFDIGLPRFLRRRCEAAAILGLLFDGAGHARAVKELHFDSVGRGDRKGLV